MPLAFGSARRKLPVSLQERGSQYPDLPTAMLLLSESTNGTVEMQPVSGSTGREAAGILDVTAEKVPVSVCQ
jgi:hypothetical protein